MVALIILVAAAAAALGGCTGPGVDSGTPGTTAAAVPPAALAALQATVAAINDSSGSPAAQRAVLDRLAAADHAAEQRRCPRATTTIRLEPVWSDVRELPGQPSVYAVPSVVRVSTQGRITGTDLTSLVMEVDGARAATTALCVA